jgi:2-dehydro-3-deoxyphosphogluconate aldolase / (4S)-4-hydroxy-2-oxoglutarate aldolase
VTKFETLGKMLYRGLLPIILADELPLLPTLEQVVAAGIDTVELAARRPAVIASLAEAKREFPSLAIGVGGLIEEGRLRDHLLAKGLPCPSIAEAAEGGADFLASSMPFREPTYQLYRETLVLMPGVSTPGEAVWAVDMGANLLRFTVPHVAGGTGFLRALDALTGHSLPICTTGPVRFELQPGYIAAGALLCASGFDMILGPDYHPMQRAFDDEYVQDGLQRFLLPIGRTRRVLYEDVRFEARDPWVISQALGRCLNV